jgi:energy-coupling factor transporter transmembrane protein EcfT
MDHSKLSAVGKNLFKLIEFDDEEELVYEVHKHPFGLFMVYFTGFLVAAIIFMALIIAPSLLSGDPIGVGVDYGTIRLILALVGGLLTILAIIMTAISAYLFESNVMLVTSEKIAQVLYRNIFDRKISQLSIGDVQDVTVNQRGILARLFNYGTIVIETAGEQENYSFSFVPRPYEASQAIVGAHERNLRLYGN